MPEITETPELRGKTMVRDIDIPSVRDRNPDPKSGPRLAVRQFRIQGLVEYPDLGITREAINSMVESIRQDLMAEGKLLPSGYTIRELGELSDLLVEIEDQTLKRHVTPLEVQRLVWLVRDQRSKRGIHLGQIEAVADRITKFYRERGFILAKAYIPKQEVRDGIVSLTLLLGMLGEVNVQGSDLYSESDIRDVFDDMLTKPITNDRVEENLYLLNDYPGLVVDGYFEPGYQVGDTRLNVNVKSEQRFSSNLRIDNHGSEDTGLYRAYADIQINNTLGIADALNISVLEAESPSNTSYYRAFYRFNLFSPRLRMILGASRNQYFVDQTEEVKISGEVNIMDATLQYVLQRSRAANHNVELKYEDMESELDIGAIDANDEKILVTSLIYNYDFLNEKDRNLHQGNIKLKSYEYVFGAKTDQKKEVEFVTLDYTLMSFISLFDADTRLVMRANAQYSETTLSTLQRFNLGGATRARAYQPNLFTADDAFYMGIDWLFSSPSFMDVNIGENFNLKKAISPFIFVDYAYGVQNNTSTVNNTAELTNWGIGLQLHSGGFRGNLQYAFPTAQKFSHPDGVNFKEEDRLVFDISYSF
ncbi:MAG: ShlB/FhaC/HecB family hemolysin secretion/activation protein [Gammaproteobacteria bacterium]|nr:ShlB/FhaC/HecB family hemolysin secretion/activation protein [Gammaproteobacteria bacterium]